MIVQEFLNIYEYIQSTYAIEYRINGDHTTLWDLKNTYNNCKLYSVIIKLENKYLDQEDIIYECENDIPVHIEVPYHSYYTTIIFDLIIERRI